LPGAGASRPTRARLWSVSADWEHGSFAPLRLRRFLVFACKLVESGKTGGSFRKPPV
jgi:hypothetical protein